ncbi:MAG: hypothetical protein ACYDCB_03950, partial [Candidatus Dormibacteria bacterium]
MPFYAWHRSGSAMRQALLGEAVGILVLVLLPLLGGPGLLGEWFNAVIVFSHQELSAYGMIGIVSMLPCL